MQSFLILKHSFEYFIIAMDCFIADFILRLFPNEL